MVDRRPSKGPKAPAAPARRAAPAAAAEETPKTFLWWAFGLHAAILFSIMVSMTALTHNLDDIKVSLYMICGPLLALSGLGLIWLRIVPPPPRWVGIGLAGYLAVNVISTIFSDFKWISGYYIQFNWIAAGFFVSAMCMGANRRSAEYFLRFLVLQILVVNVIGLLMYNLTGSGAFVGWLFEYIYPGRHFSGVEPPNLFRLLMTLNGAQNDMQSTILSRDFYAGICLLYLPFPLLMMLDPGPGRRPNLWRSIAFVAAVFDLMTIFYCFSKGEWIFTVIAIVMFAVMFFFFGQMRQIERRHMLALILGLGVLIGSQLYLRSPTVMGQLKTLKGGFSSREIMWSGAWQMFKSEPVLGCGPGTYRMYFPRYRRLDYFSNEISHVTTYSHNIFLDLLAETGFAGFGAYVLMLGALWLTGLYWAVKHPDPRIRSILVACLTALVGSYGSNLSSPNARWVIGAVNLWTVMGFMAGILLLAKSPGERPMEAIDGFRPAPDAERRMKWTLASLMACGLVIGGFSIGTGNRYWNSAVAYARGLGLMDPAMEYLDKGTVETETIQAMLERSAVDLEDAIQYEWTNASAYYKLGSIYTTLYSIYGAYANAARAKSPEQADKLLEASNNYLLMAKARYEKLEQFHPDYAQIHYNLGIIYDNYATFLAEAARLAKDKDTEATYAREAEKYVAMAQAELEKNFRMSDQFEAALALGHHYDIVGKTREACDVYEAAARRYTTNADVLEGYLKSAIATGDNKRATLALEMLWNMDPTETVRRMQPGYSALSYLISNAIEYRVDDVLTRTLVRLEKMNPADLRLFTARMELARRNNNPREMLRQIEMYRRAGGEGNQYYAMAYLAARQIGDRKKADELAGLVKLHGGIVPTSPTTPAAPPAR